MIGSIILTKYNLRRLPHLLDAYRRSDYIAHSPICIHCNSGNNGASGDPRWEICVFYKGETFSKPVGMKKTECYLGCEQDCTYILAGGTKIILEDASSNSSLQISLGLGQYLDQPT